MLRDLGLTICELISAVLTLLGRLQLHVLAFVQTPRALSQLVYSASLVANVAHAHTTSQISLHRTRLSDNQCLVYIVTLHARMCG